MLVYPSSMPVSNRALQVLADALRHHRTATGSRWRRLPPGQQALLVLAHLRKGETYADLATGFEVGTTTVYRYLREHSTCSPPWPPRSSRRSRSHAAWPTSSSTACCASTGSAWSPRRTGPTTRANTSATG